VQPILHLSVPVRDLTEARDFYVEALGCRPTRVRDAFVDVWFFGMQVTLQNRPDEAGLVPGGSRHFGVTLSRSDFDRLTERLSTFGVRWLVPVCTDDAGLPTEQTKTKIADPSGNVIEFKTYPDVAAALELADQQPPGLE
jgi:extradiol dioxygenase family protein